MDDLISRKSLLNKINAYVVGSQDKEFICKLIKEMPPARQWIPCSERLPEKDGTYFVSGVWENGDVEVGQLQYIADEHRFSNVIYFNVDAWMPLPEPYKEGEK